MKFAIYIGERKISLFDDENIRVKNSVVDSQDIDKINAEFSKSFTVPANKANNQTFKHYYDADIDYPFDARTKSSGRIELGGIPYSYGKWQLNKVNVKANKPSSYEIEYVSNLIDLKKELGDKQLSVLDLSAYDHTFNAANVKTGLQTGLFSGDMVYTLCPKKQYFYNSDSSVITDTETLTNIAWNTDTAVHGVRFTDLSPSLKVIKIIEAIETDFPVIKFSRDFLGGADFTNLYMALVNREGSVGGELQDVDFDGGHTDFVNLTTNVGSFPVQASPAPNDNVYFELTLNVTPSSGSESVPYEVITLIDGEEASVESGVGTRSFDQTIEVSGVRTFDVKYQVRVSEEFVFSSSLTQKRYSTVVGDPALEIFVTTASEQTLGVDFKTSSNMPSITIIDWLTGLFQAFKCVLIPQPDGTIYVQTLNVYYQSGTLWEVTKYVDFKESFVERGELFNEIDFKFEKPQTILNGQFLKNNGVAYGNEEAKIQDESGELIDGESYEVELPFETVVYDRLIDLDTNALTSLMYAPLVNESLSPVVPKPFFHYVNLAPIPVNGIKYVGDNSALEQVLGQINTQSHSRFLSGSGQTFLFSSEHSEWSGNLMTQSLYKSYHEDYISSIFNIKRRDFIYKIKLPPFIITRLGLGDVLKIKDRYYRIDNYDLDITTGWGIFTLINSFDNDLSGLTTGATSYTIDPDGGEVGVIISTGSASDSLIDVGFGTSWVTIDNDKTVINITLGDNATGQGRSAYVRLTDQQGEKETTDIYIFQKG